MPGKRTKFLRRNYRRGWTDEEKSMSNQSPRVFRRRMKRVKKELHRRRYEVASRELRNPAFTELFSGVLDDYMRYQQLPDMSILMDRSRPIHTDINGNL